MKCQNIATDKLLPSSGKIKQVVRLKDISDPGGGQQAITIRQKVRNRQNRFCARIKNKEMLTRTTILTKIFFILGYLFFSVSTIGGNMEYNTLICNILTSY